MNREPFRCDALTDFQRGALFCPLLFLFYSITLATSLNIYYLFSLPFHLSRLPPFRITPIGRSLCSYKNFPLQFFYSSFSLLLVHLHSRDAFGFLYLLLNANQLFVLYPSSLFPSEKRTLILRNEEQTMVKRL